MSTLVLLRHGESVWNKKNLFTGWVDVPLSFKGIEEALKAGEELKEVTFDRVYTTPLVRASMTAFLVLAKNKMEKTPVVQHQEGRLADRGKNWGEEEILPVIEAWQLNERDYGDLQGLNKDAMRKKYGEEQVQIWRRSFDGAPPGGESLMMTAERTLPYFKEEIVPRLDSGENILVAAHGNSLRSILMYLDGLSPSEVVSLELSTGKPIIYRRENQEWIRST